MLVVNFLREFVPPPPVLLRIYIFSGVHYAFGFIGVWTAWAVTRVPVLRPAKLAGRQVKFACKVAQLAAILFNGINDAM